MIVRSEDRNFIHFERAILSETYVLIYLGFITISLFTATKQDGLILLNRTDLQFESKKYLFYNIVSLQNIYCQTHHTNMYKPPRYYMPGSSANSPQNFNAYLLKIISLVFFLF